MKIILKNFKVSLFQREPAKNNRDDHFVKSADTNMKIKGWEYNGRYDTTNGNL